MGFFLLHRATTPPAQGTQKRLSFLDIRCCQKPGVWVDIIVPWVGALVGFCSPTVNDFYRGNNNYGSSWHFIWMNLNGWIFVSLRFLMWISHQSLFLKPADLRIAKWAADFPWSKQVLNFFTALSLKRLSTSALKQANTCSQGTHAVITQPTPIRRTKSKSEANQ